MSITRSYLLRFATFALVTVLSIAQAMPVAAGCLKEYGQCGDCARAAMRDAIWNIDIDGAIDAYVDAVDCDIDLAHCVFFGQHHDYDCGV